MFDVRAVVVLLDIFRGWGAE